MTPVQEALQRAIDALQIQDVYVRRASAFLADDFEPSYDPEVDRLVVGLKHLVRRYEVMEVSGDEDQKTRLLRVWVDLGTRWTRPADEEEEAPEPVAQIEATMMAEYAMREDPGEDALEAFARQNASNHIWPYWREYLSAQCLRMNLPKLTLPTRQFASNRSKAGKDEEKR